MSRAGYIYKHTSPSGQSYIGKSLTKIGRRWQNHVTSAYDEKYKEYNYPLQRAIRKYGEDSFSSEVLEDNIPEDILDITEIAYIEKYDTFYNGYNQSKGGEGVSGERSIEAKANIAKANSERVWTEEMKTNMADKKSGVNGSKFKPWWIKYPNGSYEEIHTMDKKEYALRNGLHVGSFKNMFSKSKGVGKEVLKGVYKGYAFGNIGEEYE